MKATSSSCGLQINPDHIARVQAVLSVARVRFKAGTLSGLFLLCSIQTKKHVSYC